MRESRPVRRLAGSAIGSAISDQLCQAAAGSARAQLAARRDAALAAAQRTLRTGDYSSFSRREAVLGCTPEADFGGARYCIRLLRGGRGCTPFGGGASGKFTYQFSGAAGHKLCACNVAGLKVDFTAGVADRASIWVGQSAASNFIWRRVGRTKLDSSLLSAHTK
jgi:hypothetical protein